MNLEALKGTFKRAQVWIKKNPKKAAIAGVVLAVLIYFAIKQGTNSDGESIAGEATSDTSGLDSFGAGLGSGGGGDTSAALGGGGGGGGGSSNGESPSPLSSITGADFTSAGGFDSSSLGFESSFLPEFPASSFVNSSPAFPASSASILGGSKASNTLASKPAPVVTSSPKKSESLAAKLAPSVVVAQAPKVSNTVVSKSAPKTDAEKAGLSKYFTGTSAGKIYVAGRFTGNAPIASKTAAKVSATSKSSSQIVKK